MAVMTIDMPGIINLHSYTTTASVAMTEAVVSSILE